MGTGGGRNSTGVWLTGLSTHTLYTSEPLEVEIPVATFTRGQALVQGHTATSRPVAAWWVVPAPPHPTQVPGPQPSLLRSTCSALQPEELISPPRQTPATPRWTSPWPWDIGKVGLRHLEAVSGCWRWDNPQQGAWDIPFGCQMLAAKVFMLANIRCWCILGLGMC